ncbi:Hypothetical predicted protein [Cloeon dipterum]|uniref:DNA-directed RNA polymerase subunit beta n=1 Tax=Cloeon dipterum TaxID=197152 RepID=A0A8S1CK83_9INSE|nr:Hypothetical predicted protein [Cloeon dipterum]
MNTADTAKLLFGDTKDDLRRPVNNLEEKWKLVPAYLQIKGLVAPHIDSFNYFVGHEIKKIVEANNRVVSDHDPNFYLQYEDVRVGEPRIEEGGPDEGRPATPHECRLRDMTYAAPIYCDIRYISGHETHAKKNVCIGRLPIMLKSDKCVLNGKSEAELAKLGECPLDPGGYFIVRGQEKVVLMHEQASKNRAMLEKTKQGFICSVVAATHGTKARTAVEVKKGRFYVACSPFSEPLPFVIVVKALGNFADIDIVRLVGTEPHVQEALSASLWECKRAGVFTEQQAISYCASRLKTKRFGGSRRPPEEEALSHLKNVLLSQVPVEKDNAYMKVLYLGQMVRRIILAETDPTWIDSRDYYGNKRIELAGSLLALMFEDTFKFLNTDLKNTANNHLTKIKASQFDISRHIREDKVTNGIETALSTGNWNIKRFRMARKGVTGILSRLSYISALGMMMRINSQFEKTRKVSGPRSLQPSQWGILCPSDTPEGESCGLVKNLALMAHVTTAAEEEYLVKALRNMGVQHLGIAGTEGIYQADSYLVFLNGNIIGLTNCHKELLRIFRQNRRRHFIRPYVSIAASESHRQVHISADAGRLCRPYIVVENGQSMVKQLDLEALKEGSKTFTDFVDDGLVEFLDVNEENDSLIAIQVSEITKDTTHLEIEPFTILGAVAAVIPYPHHNQSPRNTYQCAMGKQAMGTIGYNQRIRLDTLQYNMVHPQCPLVKTRPMELVSYDQLPAGQNAIVAVMSYSGFDIEDALILNKASVDRGYGRVVVYKGYKTLLRHYASGSDSVQGPKIDPLTRNPMAFHAALDSDGIAHPGDIVKDRSVLVNKHTPQGEQSTKTKTPRGSTWYVDKSLVTTTKDNSTLIKVLLRQSRIPEVGDKFSSRHGQKGVVGLIVPQEDMPFNELGICPDVIMNPHGFPSRMTVGKLIELLAGKAGSLEGKFHYGTAFGGSKVADVMKELENNGFNYKGKDLLYSGLTGEPIEAYIYHGPVFYQRLKHMVIDKMHARATGSKAVLTRQPLEGRARDGGLRVGEMERDCLISYGASNLLIERLMLASDVALMDVCEKCGSFGYQGWCQFCRSSENIATVRMPYATKLLFSELMGMNINPRLEMKPQVV